jgi:predicted membrane metal-binding protein
MWQLGFMFSLIPDSWIELATYAILSAGIVLYILSKLVAWIPVIKSYRFPIEVIGIVLYGLGAFYAGGYGVERMWRDRVADMEKKVQELEGRQAEVVTKIETKVVTKIKKVVEIKEVIKKEIEYREKEINANCDISPAAIEMYNKSVSNPEEAK